MLFSHLICTFLCFCGRLSWLGVNFFAHVKYSILFKPEYYDTIVFVKLIYSTIFMKSLPHITGCAVAQHCCNDGQQSQWKNGDFDPCRSETPENFITKMGHID